MKKNKMKISAFSKFSPLNFILLHVNPLILIYFQIIIYFDIFQLSFIFFILVLFILICFQFIPYRPVLSNLQSHVGFIIFTF